MEFCLISPDRTGIIVMLNVLLTHTCRLILSYIRSKTCGIEGEIQHNHHQNAMRDC